MRNTAVGTLSSPLVNDQIVSLHYFYTICNLGQVFFVHFYKNDSRKRPNMPIKDGIAANNVIRSDD